MAANAKRLRVLIAEDDRAVREQAIRVIQGLGHDADPHPDGLSAGAALANATYDLLLTDLEMPGATGLELIAAMRERQPDCDAIIMTGHATIDTAIEAVQLGARDYLLKPIHNEMLRHIVSRIAAERAARTELGRLRRLVDTSDVAPKLVGSSPAIEQVRELIRAVAEADSTVLIQGESGTGKELVASALHAGSPRSKHRFVPINCAAINPNVLEAEIFGYEKGAFTGADNRKLGLLEVAEGGTLFLDEIGETDPAFQSKLLRVLQEREFYRVGGTDAVPANVRVIAATNRDLRAEVDRGGFREDLFFRLNVFPIRTPPLRERPGDLTLLAQHLLARVAPRAGRADAFIAPEVFPLLRGYAWPGNVRELENLLERALLLSPDGVVRPVHLPEAVTGAGNAAVAADFGDISDLPLKEARVRFERTYLHQLLTATGGNVTEAARRSGMGRTTLHEMMKRVTVEPTDFRLPSAAAV